MFTLNIIKGFIYYVIKNIRKSDVNLKTRRGTNII